MSEEAKKKKREKRRDRLQAKHPVASLLFPTSVPHEWGDRNDHLVRRANTFSQKVPQDVTTT
jgi:hypothetical protein